MAAERPVLNPTLRLLLEPTPVAGTGRGKSRATVREGRLAEQREVLKQELEAIASSSAAIARAAGRTLVVAKMFKDSLAPTHTPMDLFSDDVGCSFVAPVRDGYLIEIRDDRLKTLSTRVERSERVAEMSDISRVRSVRPFGKKGVLRGQTVAALWAKGLKRDEGRLFTLWLMPFSDEGAREAVIQRFSGLAAEAMRGLPDRSGLPVPQVREAGLVRSSTDRALRDYRRSGGVGRAVVAVRSEDDFLRIVASGAVFRIDPVRKVSLASTPASPAVPDIPVVPNGPVVAMVDGGMSDEAYKAAEAWRVPPLISDQDADLDHGNAIASLLTHGAYLNPRLNLPGLQCRFGVAQAVPRKDSHAYLSTQDLCDLLSHMSVLHRDARVWNLSFNFQDFEDDPDVMSDFGHQISVVARVADALPVISIGNVSGNNKRLLPPADAEAALTVGGRVATQGNAAGACRACCNGPGPGGALKPEISWFSPVNVGGGEAVKGSSYAAALVSSLAAHTFERLREPTPDLVRALLINRTERDGHDPALGWGTPYHNVAPWECEPGAVTMVWNAWLEPGFDYYWRDIPVPTEMLVGDKLVGAASLTAVLRPLTSPFAETNYFSTRVEVGLQYRDGNGSWANLLGTMRESTLGEVAARNDLKKWQPIRHHKKSAFRVSTSGAPSLRVRARLYTRDLFQPGMPKRTNLPPQRVALVLTLKAGDGSESIYDTMVQRLGAFVDSAVLQPEVTIDAEVG